MNPEVSTVSVKVIVSANSPVECISSSAWYPPLTN